MIVYTAHLRPGAEPVLVPESFSWGAALAGPFWLLFFDAWIAAVLALSAEVAVVVATAGVLRLVLGLTLLWLQGLFGQDLRRWSLERRGFVLSHVVAADSADAAMARLLDQQPELVREALA